MSNSGADIERTDRVQPPATPKRRRGWLRPLLYLVIFASGSVVGVIVTLIVIRGGILHVVHHSEEMPARIAARMERALSLSKEQTRQVEVILRERQDALQDIRRKFQPHVEEELDRLEEQVSAVLDEEQRDRWRTRFDELRRTWVPALPPED